MKINLKKLRLEETIEVFNLYKEMIDEKWMPPLVMTQENFSEYLKDTHNKDLEVDLKKDEVRESVYCLYADENLCGVLFVRYSLNKKLINEGQIAYYIKKDKRNRGYGNKILSLCLDIFKDKGDKKILITCNINNKRSQKIIEKNNGILENVVGKVNRYCIDLY